MNFVEMRAACAAVPLARHLAATAATWLMAATHSGSHDDDGGRRGQRWGAFARPGPGPREAFRGRARPPCTTGPWFVVSGCVCCCLAVACCCCALLQLLLWGGVYCCSNQQPPTPWQLVSSGRRSSVLPPPVPCRPYTTKYTPTTPTTNNARRLLWAVLSALARSGWLYCCTLLALIISSVFCVPRSR